MVVLSVAFHYERVFTSGTGLPLKLHAPEMMQVIHYDRKHENPRLKEGMVLAIEPMVNAGKPDTKVLSDRWTAVTQALTTAASPVQEMTRSFPGRPSERG